MKRTFAAPALGLISIALLCTMLASRAPAQVPAPRPTSFPAATPSPSEAITGTITASAPWVAQLQTARGSVTLKLHDGTVILNPKLNGWAGPFLLSRFEGVLVGQRVYVHGFAESDGTIRTSEIDIVPPLSSTSIIPTAAPAAAR